MATCEQDATQQYVRISDINTEPLEMHMPIGGYENMPLVSLEEAVKPLESILPDIQVYVYIAKQRCKSVPADGLTKDESASIILYTMEWKPHEQCLYFALNSTLRADDRQKLEPWFLYLKLFLTALVRIPSSHRTIYRGMKMDLSSQYPPGKTFVCWGFSSCTSDMDVLESEEFLGKKGERTMFSIDCESGKDISRHSYYQSEEEIFLIAARQFVVKACLEPTPGLHIIHLIETESPVSLIKMDTSNSESSTENEEFAKPGAHDELFCEGRHCAKCGLCRDWHYTGDVAVWQWIRNMKNWNNEDWRRWDNGRVYKSFKKSVGATCVIDLGVHFDLFGHDGHTFTDPFGRTGFFNACFCEDNGSILKDIQALFPVTDYENQ